MDYRIKILDAVTGKPLPNARVSVFEADGSILVDQAPVNAQAEYILIDGSPAQVHGSFLEAGAPGHHYSYIDLPIYGENPVFIMQVYPKEVPWLLIGAGGVAALWWATSKKKKKKVSGVADYAPYIVPAAMVTGIGILVYKVGQKFGLFDDEEDTRQKEEAQQREIEYQDSMAQICQATPTTKSTADWIVIADKLENCFDYAGYLGSYRDEAVYQLCRAKNDCDVQKLIYYFGHRALLTPFLFKGGDYTLAKAVLERLDRERVDIINNNYARKGIRFSW